MNYSRLGIKKPTIKEIKKLKKYLTENEEVIFFSGISRRYYIIQLIFWTPLAFLLFGMPKLMSILRKNKEISYAITNRRFLIIEGIFSKKITSAPIHRVTHVTVEQSFLERFIYNSGDLDIITAGYDKHAIVMEKVADPIKLKVLFEELAYANRTKSLRSKSDSGFSNIKKIRSLKLQPR